jgi:hypothetical protein
MPENGLFLLSIAVARKDSLARFGQVPPYESRKEEFLALCEIEIERFTAMAENQRMD